jgi:O-antigen/teichoic acid export membrane protein
VAATDTQHLIQRDAAEAKATDVQHTKSELKRGALLNTLATIAANFRAIFTILIARLLGPITLGIFSVAWSCLDVVSKLAVIGLDDGVTTFVARANARRQPARCRGYLRTAASIAVAQSAVVATAGLVLLHAFGSRTRLEPDFLSAIGVILLALPGIALYRISTSVSRGMKVMQHDIYSRGFTESGITTMAFLAAFAVGWGIFAPEVGAVVGSTASGVVAFVLASKLFAKEPNHSDDNFIANARELVPYSIAIGADQLLNAFIWRIDLILLALLAGRAPGVTLTTVGIYGGVVGIANGLRKVSQSFTPIFAPVVAAMTDADDQERARATYAQLAEWMLWILLPLVAVLALAGNTILLVFGHTFQSGSTWLTIVATACATNAFINLGETVIMVQRPRLNLLNSVITAVTGTTLTAVLIWDFGAIGAAAGILCTYLVQGIVRNIMLRWVFHWRNSWNAISPPLFAALAAAIPAAGIRWIGRGVAAELTSAAMFLCVFGLLWQRRRRAS